MLISRRRRRGPDRWLLLKVSLLFLAAGIWVAGMLTGEDLVTGAALAVAAVGVIVSLATRGRDSG